VEWVREQYLGVPRLGSALPRGVQGRIAGR